MVDMDSRATILYGIGQLTIGGAERQFYELVRHIDTSRYRPLVFSLSSGGYYADLLRQTHVPVIELPRKRPYDPMPIWKLARIMRREKVQVLHTFGFYAGLFGRLATYFHRPPLIISSERAVRAWMKHLHNPFYFAIDRFLAKRTDVFIANANAVKQFAIHDKGILPESIEVIYNGIDTSLFSNEDTADYEQDSINQKYGFLPSNKIVGIVARLDPMKDHQTFLRSAKIILAHYPDTKFLIVGDGLLRPELELFAYQLQIQSSVYFVGSQYSKSLLQHMKRMDVIVSSSKEGEGCSNSVLEAMSMGKALVVTDVGGNAEIVSTGLNGFVVPVSDPHALSQAIETLLTNEVLKHRMGKNAEQLIKTKFSIMRMVAETTRIYEQNLVN